MPWPFWDVRSTHASEWAPICSAAFRKRSVVGTRNTSVCMYASQSTDDVHTHTARRRRAAAAERCIDTIYSTWSEMQPHPSHNGPWLQPNRVPKWDKKRTVCPPQCYENVALQLKASRIGFASMPNSWATNCQASVINQTRFSSFRCYAGNY